MGLQIISERDGFILDLWWWRRVYSRAKVKGHEKKTVWTFCISLSLKNGSLTFLEALLIVILAQNTYGTGPRNHVTTKWGIFLSYRHIRLSCICAESRNDCELLSLNPQTLRWRYLMIPWKVSLNSCVKPLGFKKVDLYSACKVSFLFSNIGMKWSKKTEPWFLSFLSKVLLLFWHALLAGPISAGVKKIGWP